ncbi:MAG: aromatic ring-hydroxylating dioxygenase subunit alpha [Gammaproteobacteria bacterium]
MKHAEQINILKELLHQMDTKTTCDAGRVLINPTSSYTDKTRAEREWTTFFEQHPQVIGLSGELPGPGSYLTNSDLGMPILATRDKNGKFHAFLNACRHRGAQLTDEPRGEKNRFICPFHAWTYAPDGRLMGIRHGEMFGEVDRACHSLIELPSQEKYGFLVVHPQLDGAVDIDALLGAELAAELANWEFDKCRFEGESSIEKALNWKLANDTFGENYHFSTLHSQTLSNLAHSDYATYREYGRNHRICTANRYLDVMRQQPESEWNFTFASIAAYYLFPNVQLVFVGGMVVLVRIYPDRHDVARSVSRITHFSMPHVKEQLGVPERATAVKADNVYSADTSARMEFDVSATIELLVSTVEHEDYQMSEKAQITASAGKLDYFLFGRNEPALHHFHNNYREALGEPPLQEYRVA